MTYQKSYQKNYYQPRRPVKSFQDLEVYQKALAVCVAVVKRINPDVIARKDPSPSLRAKRSNLDNSSGQAPQPPKIATVAEPALSLSNVLPRNDILEKLVEKLHQAVLELPVLLASAHSIRFSYPDESVKRLEEAMLKCNLSIVYLEQYRDLRTQDPGSGARTQDPGSGARTQDPGSGARTQDPGSGARPQGRIRDLEPIERDLEPIERDPEPIETEFFEEQIRNLLACRVKTMHLQMSWKKFFAEKK